MYRSNIIREDKERDSNIKLGTIHLIGLYLSFGLTSFNTHQLFIVPPTILFFILSLPFFVLAVIKNSLLIEHYKTYSFLVAAFLYLMLTQLAIGAPFARSVGFYISILYFPLTAFFAKHLSLKSIVSVINFFIRSSILIFIFELIFRITNPDLTYEQFNFGQDVRWIYKYKFSSILYADSNGTGIHLVIVFFFILYWSSKIKKRFRIEKLIILLLIFLSFSRASWAATFLGIFFFPTINSNNNLNKLLFVCAAFFIVSLSLIVVSPVLSNDLSLISKIGLIDKLNTYIEDATIMDIIFGIGFSNSLSLLGYYPHSYFIVLLMESGILGLFFMLTMFLGIFLNAGSRILIILIPFFVVTLSATITFMPFFYAVLGIIFILETNYRQIPKSSL